MISKRSLILGTGAAIITRRALALPVRNPLVYPGGNPGFNPNHPAAKGIRLSFVASMVGGFPTIITAPGVTGKPSVFSGTPTSQIRALIGPTLAGNLVVPAINEKPNSVTFAAIHNSVSNSGNGIFVDNNALNNNSASVIIGTASGIPALFVAGNTITTLGVLPLDNWFIAGSYNGSICNMVATRLSNGLILAATGSSTNTFGTPTSAEYGISSGDSYLAAASYSINNYLSLSQLEQWAAAPWDFWYPPTQRNLMASGLRSPAASGTACPPISLTGWGC